MAHSNWTETWWNDFETCYIPVSIHIEEDAAAIARVASRVAAVPQLDLRTQMLKHHDHELMLSLCHNKHVFLFSSTDQIES